MKRCQFCGLFLDNEIKPGTVHHFDVCQSESIILLHQLRHLMKTKSDVDVRCNACYRKMSRSLFVEHLEKSHPQAIALIQELTKIRKEDVPDEEIVTCNMCDDKFPASSWAIHLSTNHPDSKSLAEQISKLSPCKLKFPKEIICPFCGCEYLETKGVAHMKKCEGESVVLVKQLSDMLKAASCSQFKPSIKDRCRVCHVRFPSSTKLVDHIAEVHPSTMDLVLKLTKQVKSAPDVDIKRCSLCRRVYLSSKLANHYEQSHPEINPMAMQITEKLKSMIFKKNTSCIAQSHRPSKAKCLLNKAISILTKVPKDIRKTAKKGILRNKPKNSDKKHGEVKIIKVSADKTQKDAQNEVNVAASDDIAFEKSNDLQPFETPEKDSGLDFKAKLKENVGVTGVHKNERHKQQENNGKLFCVRLERLSSHMYQECITHGYVALQDNNCNQLPANLQANTKIDLGKDAMENYKNIISGNFNVEETSPIFAQDEISIEVTSGDNKNTTYKPVESEIVSALDVTLKNLNPYVKLERLSSQFINAHISQEYVADQEESVDQYLINDMHETIAISQEFMENWKISLMATTNNIPFQNSSEKNNKKTHKKIMKQVLHCHKLLKRYALLHTEIPISLRCKLINARKYLTDPKSCKSFLHELLVINDKKIQIAVRCAMKKVPI